MIPIAVDRIKVDLPAVSDGNMCQEKVISRKNNATY
jgi:hypothetical protein